MYSSHNHTVSHCDVPSGPAGEAFCSQAAFASAPVPQESGAPIAADQAHTNLLLRNAHQLYTEQKYQEALRVCQQVRCFA
jgi:hypothetical protein